MSILNIAPAVRDGAHLVIALVGGSGDGKTLSALLLARGLVGPQGTIGFLDSETGRGRLYANNEEFPEIGEYLYGELTPPFSPDRYVESIDEFAQAKVGALIVDTASHEWEGTGGVLDLKDASALKNDIAKWAFPKARHKRFKYRLLAARMHILICLRAREKMKESVDPQTGKKGWVSDGVHEIQDKDFIYEMTVSLRMSKRGNDGGYAEFIKCPAPLRKAFPADQQLGIAAGEYLAKWVKAGQPIDHEQQDLKQLSEAVAEKGTAELEKWWGSITKEERKRLAGYLDNLKSIAREADIMAERGREDSEETSAGADLSQPFGQRRQSEPGSGDTGTPVAGSSDGGTGGGSPWLIQPSIFATKEKFVGEFRRQLSDVVETASDVNALLTGNLQRLGDLDTPTRKMLEAEADKRRAELSSAAKRSA